MYTQQQMYAQLAEGWEREVGRMLFRVGKVKISTAVLESQITSDDLIRAFERYIRGDWGGEEEHRVYNDLALVNGDRILSTYRADSGEEFCITTENGVTQIAFLHELVLPVGRLH